MERKHHAYSEPDNVITLTLSIEGETRTVNALLDRMITQSGIEQKMTFQNIISADTEHNWSGRTSRGNRWGCDEEPILTQSLECKETEQGL